MTLCASPRTMLKWAKDGKIPGDRLSGSKRITWRFLQSELDAMLTLPSAANSGEFNEQQSKNDRIEKGSPFLVCDSVIPD